MSATPIPRTLMLTLFSHLRLSYLDELPPGVIPTKTWLVPKKKQTDSWQWIGEKIQETSGQALVVCPFIEPSASENLANVSAATKLHEELATFFQQHFPKLTVGLLHGQLKQVAKQTVIEQLFEKKLDLVVTTPVVEVGVDLPHANVVVIEAAERFGLASLHQLRGRVGRAGQESYCLLFTTASQQASRQRLLHFTQEHRGLQLAEEDLKHRGAGDLFGFQQHGFQSLRFASWTNLTLIQQAHQLASQMQEKNLTPLLPYQVAEHTADPTNN